jgi:hypothetical protein
MDATSRVEAEAGRRAGRLGERGWRRHEYGWRAGGSQRITDPTSRLEEAAARSLVVHNRRRGRAGRLESGEGVSSTGQRRSFFPPQNYKLGLMGPIFLSR